MKRPAPDRILRERDVCALLGVHRTTIWKWMYKGQFPQRIRLSARSVGWRESEVHAWIASRETVTT